MNSHITHYSSIKQNNDFILYHNRAKSSLSVSPTPQAHDKSPISELMKDFTKNHMMLSREERLPLSGVSSPKNFMAQSPKLVTLRELPEGIIEPKPIIQTEREKRATDLEKENKELKSLLKSRDAKIAQFLKENENIQKRLVEYKSKEKLSNFNQIDVDNLKDDLEKCLVKIQSLEKEKADLLEDRSTWFKTTEEIDQGLVKYTKYVLHYVNKTDSHNFINFCFEDRFSSEKSLLILLQTKNYGIIALQAFKYLSDLLTRIGALQNPNQEQNKSPYPSERPRGSEPSSICLSPLKNESREGTPRDLVKEMLEGTRLFMENFDKSHNETPTPNSYKSPKNNGTTQKKDEIKNTLKKSNTTADLHKKQPQPPNTSRNVRIDVTNSATRLALKKQLSPKQSMTPQPQRQGTPKATTTPLNSKQPTYAKMHAKNEAIADIRRWTEKENIGDQSGSKKLTLVERLEKEDKNKLENERVVLFSECASRRNSNHVRKEADSKAKIPKNDVRKNSNSNIGKLEARRDSHQSALRTKNNNISENQFSKRASMSKADLEESDRKSPFSVKSILKNAFENKAPDNRYNQNEDFLDVLEGPSNLNKKRNREPLEIQVDTTGKRSRNFDENKEEYFSQKGCASSDLFPKEKTSPKTSPKALVGSLNFDSLRNRGGSPTSNLTGKDNIAPSTKDNKALHRETPLLSSDDRLGRVLNNQSPLSIEGGDSSARWLAKDLAMFKTIPEPQPQDKLDRKISYEDLRVVHFDDETKLAPQKFIARQMSRQEALHKDKDEKAERFVTFDGNDDLFTCGDKGDTPKQSTSKRNTPKADQKNLFTNGGATKVSFDMIPERDKAQEVSQCSTKIKENNTATHMGTLEFNTSRSNYNVRDHQQDGYSSARNRIFASEISGITHDKSLGGDEWY